MTTVHKAPQGNPGDIMNWPMIKIEYRTDADAIARQLPPGITVGKDPKVFLTIYNYPVNDRPELGCTMMVAADYNGMQGQYALGYAIDQEDEVYVSREHWGQPKFEAKISKKDLDIAVQKLLKFVLKCHFQSHNCIKKNFFKETCISITYPF